MTEISERYRAVATEFTRRVDGVPDERWADPSPCAGWTARDVVRHVVDTMRTVPGWAALPHLELIESVDEDPHAAWAEARDAMRDVLADPARAGTPFEGFVGPTTLERSIDQFVVFDLVVHAWDLARATGQDETMPPDDVRLAAGAVAGFGPALRGEGVCGPEVTVPDDASEQDRLLGLLGRTP
jgi:uncharacterized protein (TIGR03086 family)